uniref:Uncharacterized protein n=1 Tax=Glossina austeni TaxID=7395 RepID=A0A1A9UXW3_GLOAU
MADKLKSSHNIYNYTFTHRRIGISAFLHVLFFPNLTGTIFNELLSLDSVIAAYGSLLTLSDDDDDDDDDDDSDDDDDDGGCGGDGDGDGDDGFGRDQRLKLTLLFSSDFYAIYSYVIIFIRFHKLKKCLVSMMRADPSPIRDMREHSRRRTQKRTES